NELDSFLNHDADVVIEAVGGEEPARTIACSALRRGKKVITANKELVASHGSTLSALALENETGLDFGAAVGGSAPVISTLRDLVGACTPLSVRGILNGTSNYVITLLESGAVRKSTRLTSSNVAISYAVVCLKKKTDRRTATELDS